MDHQNNLLNICRLCMQKIKIDSKYTKAKAVKDYKVEIDNLFSYDTDQDDVQLHPKFLCSRCHRKLDRCRNLNQEFEKVKIAVFTSHSNECDICLKKMKKHEFSVTVKRTFTNLQDEVTISLTFDHIICLAKKYGWILFNKTNDSIVMCRYRSNLTNPVPILELTLTIKSDFSWNLYVFNKLLDITLCEYTNLLPSELTYSNIDNFIIQLNKANICVGNNDFNDLMEWKMKKNSDLTFKDKSDIIKAHMETVMMEDIQSVQTIRVINCKLLLGTEYRCNPCKEYRKILGVISNRLSEKEETIEFSKFTTNVNLTKEQLQFKNRQYAEEIKILKSSRKNLLMRINKIIEEEAITIEPEINNICLETIENEKEVDLDSPHSLLWEEQKKYNKLKNSKSMRWHPVMIRWCLSIYLRSPGSYEHLRESGFLKLPHKGTLLKYSDFTDMDTCFNIDVIKKFLEDIKVDTLKSYDKIVSLMFDEMKIKSGLVFSKSTGKMVGFTDMGDINNELEKFQRFAKSGLKEPELATHVLTLMARGLFKRFNYPIGYFASLGMDSDQLYSVIWDGVAVLEGCGINVKAFVCDGAAPNRKFYRLHEQLKKDNVSEDGVVFWSWNKYNNQKKIYFICDPPHLIKTLRNNIENSHGHNNTRQLVWQGKEISWQHIVSLYEMDLAMNREALGLRKLHKLRDEHINLSPRLRMRVNLAAQVLSSTVAKALEIQNGSHTEATQKFIEFVDTFFDCLNVSSTYAGKKKLKEALKPYTSLEDWRFKWLEETFLGFINGWKEECDRMVQYPKDMRSRFCLSYQTIEGLRVTVHAFVAVSKELLCIEGVKYFLSDKLNQDPLEEHFGKQRMRGGGSDNPTLEEYAQNEKKILVAKSDMIRVMRGNTRGRQGDGSTIDVSDTTPLLKRKKR